VSDIFREVDEEVRQEQLIGFVKRYGAYLAVVVVLAIIGVVGHRYWQDHQRQQHAALGEAFDAAMLLAADGKTEEATAALRALAEREPGGGYGLLARFRLAEMSQNSGDSKAAQGIYDAIAGDRGVPRVYRDLAGYHSAALALDAGGGPELAARLDAMAGEDNPWNLFVLELKGLNQYKTGQRDAAKATFRDLLAKAPADSNFRLRSQQMLAVLGVPFSEIDALVRPAGEAK
jgi:hypothetical protein